MQITTIQLNQEAKRELAIVKYKLDAKDYSETILRLIKISREIKQCK